MKRKDSPAAASPAAPGTPGTESQSFETMMTRLEDLVTRLEEGNLPLEDSIRSFEEGMALVRQCTAVLQRAEERIQKLTRDAAGAPAVSALPMGREERDEAGSDELPF